MRTESFLGEPELATLVRGALEAVQGVFSVSHAPVTGSLLIEYAPGVTDVESLLAIITDTAGLRGIIDEQEARGLKVPLAEQVVRGAKWLDSLTRELTGAGLHELIPAALTASAIYSLFRKPPSDSLLPRWDNALYWAYNLFRDGLQDQARHEG